MLAKSPRTQTPSIHTISTSNIIHTISTSNIIHTISTSNIMGIMDESPLLNMPPLTVSDSTGKPPVPAAMMHAFANKYQQM
jgi:hypothetical protein